MPTQPIRANSQTRLLSTVRIFFPSDFFGPKISTDRPDETWLKMTFLSAFQISIFQHIKSLANDEEGLINICRQLVNDDVKLMTEMALLFQFTLPKRPKMSSSNDDDDITEEKKTSSETSSFESKTIEAHEKAIQWLAEKVKSESNGNQLHRDVILPMDDVMIKPGFEKILQSFGFIQLSGKFILQKGQFLSKVLI